VTATLRSEWIKLRTVRMNTVLVIIGVLFPYGICVLTAVFSDSDVSRRDILGFTTGASLLTALILGVVGASSITGEFTHNTIRPTFAATPRRMRVLIAKTMVLAAGSAAVTLFVVLGNFAVTMFISDRRNRLTPSNDFDPWPALVGTVLLGVLVTLFGYGIGLLVRNQPTAIALLLLWPLLVEGLISGLLFVAGVDDPSRWMPYSNGLRLASPDTIGDGLSRVGGGLYFFAFVAAIAAAGALITSRRDA
jgi:ABC-2 type transport system permease protein